MSRLIRNNEVVANPEDLKLLPLSEFLLLEEHSGVGVIVDSDEEIEALADVLASIPAIALHFPAFTDGRPYSSATILRRRYHYRGEIRAIGDVRPDQLEQMYRCGFNAFQLPESANIEQALGFLSGFSYSYQQTVDREPLYRNRAA